MNLLANERVNCEQQGQTSIFMSPFLEIREILERARCDREITDVQILERDEKRMELVHHLLFRSCW